VHTYVCTCRVHVLLLCHIFVHFVRIRVLRMCVCARGVRKQTLFVLMRITK